MTLRHISRGAAWHARHHQRAARQVHAFIKDDNRRERRGLIGWAPLAFFGEMDRCCAVAFFYELFEGGRWEGFSGD